LKEKEQIASHIKTHSLQSSEDVSAVATLKSFLAPGGKINPNFASNDKWPNIDGTFELVPTPELSHRPKQSFVVQIKGTTNYTVSGNGSISYSLRDLAFPAYISEEITLDPGILFVVLDPDSRGKQRIFWKYISMDFINSIDWGRNSKTVSFSIDEEIKNTNESVDAFCQKLVGISERHSFIKKLENREFSKEDAIRIIESCDESISESIDRFDYYNDTRDNVSKRILTKLSDLCSATLLLNLFAEGDTTANFRLAWEKSQLDIETKYLGTFLRGIKYIGGRVPQDGQSERLMLKYYDFMWQIRRFLKRSYGLNILLNLDKFPHSIDEADETYYSTVATSIASTRFVPSGYRQSRYYIQKKNAFYYQGERYFEVTLQLAGVYATKYNRITAYTTENISTDYSVQIAYDEIDISLWGISTKIKVITNWKVSIDPTCLNKLAKVLKIKTSISKNYGEYNSLMDFLTSSGLSLLDFIDLKEVKFDNILDSIYHLSNTHNYKDVLLFLRQKYSIGKKTYGKNTVRYLMVNLREELFKRVMPNEYTKNYLCDELNLSSRCIPFEKNPYISNLAGSNTSKESLHTLRFVAGEEDLEWVYPYLYIENGIKDTGEIYFEKDSVLTQEAIDIYNNHLDDWEKRQGYQIKIKNGYFYIDAYEQSSIFILDKLRQLSNSYNAGQSEYNKRFISNHKSITDPLKIDALLNAFVNSNLLMIYGAAGTGKTTLMNHLSDLMESSRKLFMTKTHTALQNLKRRIVNPGTNSDFISIDSFTKRIDLSEYDIVFVDECSTIDNRTMLKFLQKINEKTLIVLAGDIYQIESIDFGNWFYYAKDIITTAGTSVELLSTWRTEKRELIDLWSEVRVCGEIVTERLSMDGPFSEEIGDKIFERETEDEVVLCLNYDGKFGLNNMNTYFQNKNQNGITVYWREWAYKIGDPILFNQNERYPILYNNLKGKIVDIKSEETVVTFTIDVDDLFPQRECDNYGLEYLGIGNEKTRIRFSVYSYEVDDSDDNAEEKKRKSVVPFQLAYAVSIHKAQGLEYDSVKVVIPNSNSEKITHGIFYTAITRAKNSLKIFWDPVTMNRILSNFSVDKKRNQSLTLIREQLQ